MNIGPCVIAFVLCIAHVFADTAITAPYATFNATVGASSYSYFTLAVPAALGNQQEWRLTLIGNAAMYVREANYPAYNSYDFSVNNGLNEKSIFISACSLDSAVWYVAVYGNAGSVPFQLTSSIVARPCSTALTSGSTVDSWTIASSNYQRYFLEIPAEKGNQIEWTLTLTGTSALYVREAAWPLYNSWDFRDVSNLLTKKIFISACSLSSNIWDVAVYGISTLPQNFTLTSEVVERPCVTELPHVTTSDDYTVVPGNYQFYHIAIETAEAQTFQWTLTVTGDVSIYIRQGARPAYNSYDYSSTAATMTKTITLTPGDVESGDWFVGIYGRSSSIASYNLTSKIEPHMFYTQLTRGSSDSWIIPSGTLLIYYIDIPMGETQPLTFILQGSDANLYLNRNERPYTNSYIKAWTGNAGTKTLVVSVNDLTNAPRILAMVYAQYATANITISISQDTQLPSPGTVIDGVLATDISCWPSTSYLAASWYGFSALSGIVNYDWMITSSSGSTILDWTSVGLVNQASANVTLRSGSTYYTSVRATSGAGLQISANSSGVTVASSTLASGTAMLRSASLVGGRSGLVVSWTGFSSTCGITYSVELLTSSNTTIGTAISVGSSSSTFLDSATWNLTPSTLYGVRVTATASGTTTSAYASAIYGITPSTTTSNAVPTSSPNPTVSPTSPATSTTSATGNCQVAVKISDSDMLMPWMTVAYFLIGAIWFTQ